MAIEFAYSQILEKKDTKTNPAGEISADHWKIANPAFLCLKHGKA